MTGEESWKRVVGTLNTVSDIHHIKMPQVRSLTSKLTVEMFYPKYTGRKARGIWQGPLPKEWPKTVPFLDPCNKNKDGHKPKKEDLIPMLRFLVHTYKTRSGQWVNFPAIAPISQPSEVIRSHGQTENVVQSQINPIGTVKASSPTEVSGQVGSVPLISDHTTSPNPFLKVTEEIDLLREQTEEPLKQSLGNLLYLVRSVISPTNSVLRKLRHILVDLPDVKEEDVYGDVLKMTTELCNLLENQKAQEEEKLQQVAEEECAARSLENIIFTESNNNVMFGEKFRQVAEEEHTAQPFENIIPEDDDNMFHNMLEEGPIDLNALLADLPCDIYLESSEQEQVQAIQEPQMEGVVGSQPVMDSAPPAIFEGMGLFENDQAMVFDGNEPGIHNDVAVERSVYDDHSYSINQVNLIGNEIPISVLEEYYPTTVSMEESYDRNQEE